MTYKRCFNDNLKRVTKGLKPRIHDFLFFGSFVVVLALAFKRGNSVAHLNEWTIRFRLKCSGERVFRHKPAFGIFEEMLPFNKVWSDNASRLDV
ncbi:hypothetical protein LP7551_05232 [Roseibium album]|nr:hypothetical protein LP7551_05232 [Roseibium album]